MVVSAGALPSGGQTVAATGTTPTETPWPRADLPALQQVWQALATVADGTTVGLLTEQKPPSTRPNTRHAFTYTADVSDAGAPAAWCSPSAGSPVIH